MAGNSIDELFVTIGLKGAKNATQELFKFEKSLEVSEKQAETLVDVLNKLQGSQKKSRKETTKSWKEVKKSGQEAKKSANHLMTLARSFKFVGKAMKGTFGFLGKFTRGFGDILKIGLGVSLGNAISRIPGMISGAIGSGISVTADEQQARRQATKGLITGQVDTPANQAMIQKTAVELRTQFSIPLADTFKSFGKVVSRSNNDIKKIQRIISLSAVMKSKVGSKVDFDTLVRQLDLFTRGGELEESLREAAPFLKEFRDSGQDRNKALDLIAREFKFLPKENFQTFNKALERLQVLGGEGVKSFFRPILEVLTKFFNRVSVALLGTESGTVTGKTPGESVAAGINSLLPSADRMVEIINKVQNFLDGPFSKFIDMVFAGIRDIAKLFMGEESAAQKAFGGTTPGETIAKMIGEGITSVLVSLVESIGTGGKLNNLFVTLANIFAAAFESMLRSLIPAMFLKRRPDIGGTAVFTKNQKEIKMLRSMLNQGDFNLKDFIRGTGVFGGKTIDELKKLLELRLEIEKAKWRVPGTPTGTGTDQVPIQREGIEPLKKFGSTINMNNDINIVTTQAAEVIRTQLSAQMSMLGGGMGRLA